MFCNRKSSQALRSIKDAGLVLEDPACFEE
jgi:hypothetical protein